MEAEVGWKEGQLDVGLGGEVAHGEVQTLQSAVVTVAD